MESKQACILHQCSLAMLRFNMLSSTMLMS